jgi:hypothetical protein
MLLKIKKRKIHLAKFFKFLKYNTTSLLQQILILTKYKQTILAVGYCCVE